MNRSRGAKRRKRGRAALVVAACATVLLALAAPASATTVTNQRPLLFSFDGSDTTAGRFRAYCRSEFNCGYGGVGAVAFDHSTGSVYAIDETAEVVDKFDAEGKAEDYAAGPAAGTSSLYGPSSAESFKAQQQFFFGGGTFIAIDNSGGLGGAGEGEQGRLYVGGGSNGPIDAFDHNGNFLWSLPAEVSGEEVTKGSQGIAVDTQGHLWVAAGDAERDFPGGFENYSREKILEFDTTGSGTPPTTPIREIQITNGAKQPLAVAIDKSGEDLYVSQRNSFFGPSETSLDKYVGGTFDSTLSIKPRGAIAIDQTETAGDIFTIATEAESILEEYEPCSSPGCGGTPLSASDPGLIGNGRGVAYNPARDWVYVPDRLTETVKVFAPLASGPVPTVSEGETDEVTKTEATAHGTVNPAGLPNSYHFEWVRAEVQKIVVEPTSKLLLFETPFGNSETLPADISPTALQAELEKFYGTGNVSVTGYAATSGIPGEYRVLFEGGLAGQFVGLLRGRYVDPEQPEVSVGQPSITRVSRGQLWGESEQQRTRPESYPAIEPTDSSNHAVLQRLTNLQPNTAYDVRLVGTNTEPEGDPEKRLDDYSAADTFTTLPPPPPEVSGLAVSGVTTNSAEIAATIDPEEDETTWRALVDPGAPYGVSQAECEALSQSGYELAAEGTIPFGETGAVAIERELTGLEPGETYCLRLVAVNGGGSAEEDRVLVTTAVKPTEAKLAFVAPRTDTGARLNFYVNPQGDVPLTYRFEYSPDGANWTQLEEVVSTTDAHRQIVLAEEVEGLAPATGYYYRLGLVKNEAGSLAPGGAGKGRFTTRTSAEMTIPPNALGEAEKRGIELVNSPDKGNQHIHFEGHLPSYNTPDGEELIWTVANGAPGGPSGTENSFLASRSAEGWRSQTLLPPASEQVGGGNLKYFPAFASTDFSRFVFRVGGGLLSGENPTGTYVRLDDHGDQEVLAHFDANAFATAVDVSADTAHVLHVTEDTHRLQDIGSGTPEEVGLMANGSPPTCGIDFNYEFDSPNSTYQYPGHLWISSTDASRVYFQTRGDECGGPSGLYARNREAGTTTLIARPGSFIRATPDGRSGYFVTAGKCRRYQQSGSAECAEGATEDKNNDLDVYRWDEASEKSSCLTCMVADADVAPIKGGVRISDDFSHVYFASTRRLIPNLGTEGDLNVYVLSGGGGPRFVADVNGSEGNPLAGHDSMQMSADGTVMAFLAGADRLTADRIAPRCANPNDSSHPCQELYRYDDREGSIECISCLRDGTTTKDALAANQDGSMTFRMSADGTTIAFVTEEALLPQDINDAPDVYEWRNGALRLISDGESEFSRYGLTSPTVAGIDAHGDNVFFLLSQPGLTGFEQDGLDNVYDARLGGGFPRPQAPVHCSEESCQGPLQGAPAPRQQASALGSGPGNLPSRPRSRRCGPHRVRRHGRCLKRHHRHPRAKKKNLRQGGHR
jgi:DNA-binding beta-propeller fold protein YncE